MTEIKASRTASEAFAAEFPLRDVVLRELERRWPAGATGVEEVCRDALLPPGKLFRPCLLLASAQAVGGDPMKALPAAIAAEYGHVASLIHDDIIDADTVRRGRPAAHRKYGADEALIAGDLLFFSVFEGLAECRDRGIPADRVVDAVGAIARAGTDLGRGQSLEARLTGSRVFEVGQYLEMVRLKTAALFRAACEIGGILGGGGPSALAALVSYANHLGVAFQVHDDLLPYTSDRTARARLPRATSATGVPCCRSSSLTASPVTPPGGASRTACPGTAATPPRRWPCWARSCGPRGRSTPRSPWPTAIHAPPSWRWKRFQRAKGGICWPSSRSGRTPPHRRRARTRERVRPRPPPAGIDWAEPTSQTGVVPERARLTRVA
ncbi:polyprenyl synthetase family protein [Streptomyces hundungensis]|uniref:polyprenyl synthetase family protein n=1 Tax=Streptomyces hundungensis TaxID=1077946 RepID=UPI0033F04A26